MLHILILYFLVLNFLVLYLLNSLMLWLVVHVPFPRLVVLQLLLGESDRLLGQPLFCGDLSHVFEVRRLAIIFFSWF